jgi:hypothetical protein
VRWAQDVPESARLNLLGIALQLLKPVTSVALRHTRHTRHTRLTSHHLDLLGIALQLLKPVTSVALRLP